MIDGLNNAIRNLQAAYTEAPFGYKMEFDEAIRKIEEIKERYTLVSHNETDPIETSSSLANEFLRMSDIYPIEVEYNDYTYIPHEENPRDICNVPNTRRVELYVQPDYEEIDIF